MKKTSLIIFFIFFIFVSSVSAADTWEYTLFIYDTFGNTDVADDVQIMNSTLVVDEGTTGTYFGGSNSGIANLSIDHTYFVFIKGNTTEADYNYDADSEGETYFSKYTPTSGYSVTRFVVPIDDDSQVLCGDIIALPPFFDVMFWSTVFDASITEAVADTIDYTIDGNILERWHIFVTGGTCEDIDFKDTEQSSGDTDPENGGFTGWDSQSMTVGEWYYWGVIFKVDDEWNQNYTDVWTFHHEGEGGDLDQEVNWNWTLNANVAPNITISYPGNNTKFNTTFNYNISFNISDINDNLLKAELYINNTLNSTINYPALDEQYSFLFNASPGYYNIKVRAYDSANLYGDSQDWTIRINFAPTMTGAELNKTSGVGVTDELNCTPTGKTDADSEDTLTYHYEWYNTSTAKGIDDFRLNSENLTIDSQWYCEAWVNDSYLISSKYTSSTIIVGSSESAPSIDYINASTDITGINSTSTNPTKNNTWLNMTLWFTDSDANNKWTAYFCDTPNWADCENNVSGAILCSSSANQSSKVLSCIYNVTGSSRIGEQTFYGFALDNTTLHSTGKSETFEVNHPPSVPTLVFPSIDTYFNVNYTRINWTATDIDGDTINYTLWVNLSTNFEFFYNGTKTGFNFTNATIEYNTYTWRIYTQDLHGYGLNNITLGNFTNDWTNPNMSVSSPTNDATYNSITTPLTVNAKDNFIDVCNYTMYLKDTGGFYSNGTVNCTGTTSISTPYYSASYKLDIFSYDLAGNYNITQLNFTTEALLNGNGGNGGGGGTVAPEKQIIERKVEVIDRCGNLFCDEEETPVDCPIDCKYFSLDEMFCLPLFACGNWNRSWFINSMIIFIIVGMVYFQYRSTKLKKKRL